MMQIFLKRYFNYFSKKLNRALYHFNFINHEKLLSEDNMQQCIKRYNLIQLQQLQKIEKTASVLIPLCYVNNELSLLYTLRAIRLARHKNQISFPGGMSNKNENAIETALRETEEEIYIHKTDIKVYGCGSSVERKGILITPVIGYIGHITPANLNINKDEVALVLTLPLSELCNPNNFRFTKFKNGYTLPIFLIGGYRIWGITGYITHIFLKCFIPEIYKFNIED